MPHLLVIGGSDAGISAALRAREIDPALEVSVALDDHYPNFSVCGLPFFIAGEVPDWRSLAHRPSSAIESQGVRLLPGCTATRLDAAARRVTLRCEDGQQAEAPYDRLIVATGARAVRPSLAGLDLPGVFMLRSMGDGLAIDAYLRDAVPTTAVIVGGGYIGCEMAEALRHRGLAVTLLEGRPAVLASLDRQFGAAVGEVMAAEGVRVVTGASPLAIEPAGAGLSVRTAANGAIAAGLVVVATGVAPRAELATAAGIGTGQRGAIVVDRSMHTGAPGVYAAGDCVETWHRLLGRPVYLPLGTTAHKQGSVAGENAAGGSAVFAGSLGTQVVRVFGAAVGRTGLSEAEAAAVGLVARTAAWRGNDHNAYYPGAALLQVCLTAEWPGGRLLGAQLLGPATSAVAQQLNVLAEAIACVVSVGDLEQLDFSYTPPLGTPWDPVQLAARAWRGGGSRLLS